MIGTNERKARLVNLRVLRLAFLAVLVLGITLKLTACSSLSLPADEEHALAEQAAAVCLARRGAIELVPEKPFRTDGCSAFPDGNWQQCCITHDMDYWCGGDSSARSVSDKTLKSCVANAGHPMIGSAMWLGTRTGGLRAVPMPWRWGYGWGYLADMQREEPD